MIAAPASPPRIQLVGKNSQRIHVDGEAGLEGADLLQLCLHLADKRGAAVFEQGDFCHLSCLIVDSALLRSKLALLTAACSAPDQRMELI
jgi:hypothetical protein